MIPTLAPPVGGVPVPRDSLRVVLDSVFAGPAYDWTPRVDPLQWLTRGWNLLTGWLDAFRDGSPVLYQWFLLGLVALLVAIIVHAGWTLLQTIRPRGRPVDHLDARPTPAPHDAAWYRRYADQCATEGQYASAIQAGWHALVLDLDARGLVRYRVAKTPGEYPSEPALDQGDRDRLRRLVEDLYRFVFGRERCTEEEYLAWQSRAAGEWRAAST